ncbi:hypothetical protein ACQKWADRAFT_292035 [Trichoderma austrokoningii]
MRGPGDFFFSGKEPFKKHPPDGSPAPSKESPEHVAGYKEVLDQLEKDMEGQVKKIFDLMFELKKDLEYRIKNLRKHLEVTEARIEDLSNQLNSLSAKQSAAEYNSRARDQNSLVTSKEMLLCPLRNPETNNDVLCPATLGELESYSGSELDALLQSLGEPVPIALKHKMEIAKWAMGIRNSQYN